MNVHPTHPDVHADADVHADVHADAETAGCDAQNGQDTKTVAVAPRQQVVPRQSWVPDRDGTTACTRKELLLTGPPTQPPIKMAASMRLEAWGQ